MSRRRVVFSCASMLVGALILMWACDEFEPAPPPAESALTRGECGENANWRSVPLPEEVRALGSWDAVRDWIMAQDNARLYEWGLSLSPCGNFLLDPSDVEISPEGRDLCAMYLAATAGVRGINAPEVATLRAFAHVDTVEEIIEPGSAEEMRPAVIDTTVRRYLLFTPPRGPKYGFSFPDTDPEGSLDEDPIYGVDVYYLHRTGGSPTGQLLSWVDTGSSLRTTGVFVKQKYVTTKIEFSSSYWYSGYDAPYNRKVTHPCSQQFTPQNCDGITETCTAVSYYATNGFTWRPGCVSGQCANPARFCGDEDLLSTTDGPRTRGCPNVHYYSNWNGGVDYTGYNDDRWRIDNATLEGYPAGVRTVSVPLSDSTKVVGRTVYALCVPYFKAYMKYSTTDTSSVPLWYQLYDGWLSDTAWGFNQCSITNWRGSANRLRVGGEWICNSGCCPPSGSCADGCASDYCDDNDQTTVSNLWMATWNGVHKWPHKAKMLWWSGQEPWNVAGKIYGRHRIWNYDFGDDPCAVGGEDRVTRSFGYVDFTDNSYTTTVTVSYVVGSPH